MPERPKIYHGHYVVAVYIESAGFYTYITMKHPLKSGRANRPPSIIVNWLAVSGLKEDFDAWGYAWNEGIEP